MISRFRSPPPELPFQLVLSRYSRGSPDPPGWSPGPMLRILTLLGRAVMPRRRHTPERILYRWRLEFGGQRVEVRLACSILNRMTAMGRLESYAVRGAWRGRMRDGLAGRRFMHQRLSPGEPLQPESQENAAAGGGCDTPTQGSAAAQSGREKGATMG